MLDLSARTFHVFRPLKLVSRCLAEARDTTVLPCRHMCMCRACAGELRRQSSRCPICRVHVESLLHIPMARGGAGGRSRERERERAAAARAAAA